MKLLLFSIFLTFALSSSAQEYRFRVFGNPPGGNTNGPSLQQGEFRNNDSMITAMKKYIETHNLKSGVVNLSQDNMPCVIPNTNLMNPMPNAMSSGSSIHIVPNPIPNPARPTRPWTFVPISFSVPKGKVGSGL